MAFKASDSATKIRYLQGDQSSVDIETLSNKIKQLKNQILTERIVSVKEKLVKNAEKLCSHVAQIISTTSRNDGAFTEGNRNDELLFSRMEHPLCVFTGIPEGVGDKDFIDSHEVGWLISAKLPHTEKLPPYTTWIFLDRNQRMSEDQSVVGKRRIYYDQHGSEALICSDSEEEVTEPEEEKCEFSEGEDRIIWMACQEHGEGEETLNTVSKFIGSTATEILERYNKLIVKIREKQDQKSKGSKTFGFDKGISLDKTLSAALDSFDNLFCRRCMLFDCPLHGCSQLLIYPSEKQVYWSGYEEYKKPCSDQCYLKLRAAKQVPEIATGHDLDETKSETPEQRDKALDIIQDERCISGETMPVASESVSRPEVEIGATSSDILLMEINRHERTGKRKTLQSTEPVENNPPLLSNDFQGSKKQKKLSVLDAVHAISGSIPAISAVDCDSSCKNSIADDEGPQKNDDQGTTHKSFSEAMEPALQKLTRSGIVRSSDKSHDVFGDEPTDFTEKCEPKKSPDAVRGQAKEVDRNSEWKTMEKELYLKGLEMFGRNSCLIARNLLSGLKTCIEISGYMHSGGASMPRRSDVARIAYADDKGKADISSTDIEFPTRSRLLRRKGKTRKLKYSWKSAGNSFFWKRIADGKNQSCKQYIPCGCQSMCGKQCLCLDNGTCCEKYCGCSKSCKNRFRGCHCAKSQCRSRQCPCFAAGRECDPDVCRNCWVSCGDGSLGEPPRQGEGQCGNMRLLLRQQQRILLAKSDVAGWGAFLKNSVNKNDYLGEYTGELISHREADKRGKIYDRANSSFLFDLNDQYVLDAYRKGDKLKFANHSSNPNCYAKVMLVAGDHRVGIFAKEHIESSEELFYDYRYGPDQAPAWARRPEGSKRDEAPVSQGRAKKHQSH